MFTRIILQLKSQNCYAAKYGKNVLLPANRGILATFLQNGRLFFLPLTIFF